MSHEKPPIDFIKKAKEKGKKISREDFWGKDLDRDFSIEREVDDKVVDLDAEKFRRNEQMNPDNFNPRREFEKIGVEYFRKVEAFLKKVELPIDELKLKSYSNRVKKYSDYRLLENYRHFEASFWLNSLEFYTAVFNEVKKRYSNQ